MKNLRLYGLAAATLAYGLATASKAEQIGSRFVLFDDVERIKFATTYTGIAAAKIAGSDSAEVKAVVDSLFQEALNRQKDTIVPLSWTFDVTGNKMGLVGKLEGADPATADILVILGDSVHVDQKTIPKQKAQSSPLTGARFGVSYGPVSPELGLVFGNRVVLSGSPYSLPSARDPKATTTYTTPDPVFGTMYETTVDTARVAKSMRNLSLGVILPQYKGLEATLGAGIHWEENSVKGYAETGKVDRNYVPLKHADGRSGPFHSGESSTKPMVNLGLDYNANEHDAIGFYYQRVLGKNGKNRVGFGYRRNF